MTQTKVIGYSNPSNTLSLWSIYSSHLDVELVMLDISGYLSPFSWLIHSAGDHGLESGLLSHLWDVWVFESQEEK